MWEPNEQLILRAPVRYKNRDGSLFVTPLRVAWQQQGIPQLNPSISYDTISALAQTPESSAKVIFKITTNPPEPKEYKFLFTSIKALTEREGIKAQITELWAKSKGVTASAVGTPTPFTPSSPATQINNNRSPVSTPKNIPSTPTATTPLPPTPQQPMKPIKAPTPVPPTKSNAPSPRVSSPANSTSTSSSGGLQQWRQQEFNAQ
ncbi:unnamed protein product [Cunninghamella blakesleeana]